MSPVFRVHNGSGHVSSIVTKVGKFSEEIGIVGNRGGPSWKGMSSSGLKFEEQVSVKEIVIFLSEYFWDCNINEFWMKITRKERNKYIFF